MIVLGLDPGFAALGLAAVDLTPGAERVERAWVVRTEKAARKVEVRASDDNVRRARQLAAELERAVVEWGPVALAAEAQSWPRNAGASAKVGIAWGVVAALAERHGLPLVQASPQDVKRAVAGAKTASKGEVAAAVEARFPEVEWPRQASLVEHAADAVAVVLACLDSPVLQLARRLAAEPAPPEGVAAAAPGRAAP